jgi:glycosyltransferase involved in cell wall biosynthesis
MEKLVAVTPAKNEEENIQKCIQSVINQSYPVVLHIVVDDCSDDETVERIEKMRQNSKIIVVNSGLTRRAKKHGIRPHLVQQVGIDKITEIVPDWKYLLCLDADCLIPNDYCSLLIKEMENDERIALVGAKFWVTPSKTQEISDIHVQNGDHIIKRQFYEECLIMKRNYATHYGEMLLERHAFIYGWKVKTVPITLYETREAGITEANPLTKGEGDYRLGMPFLSMLTPIVGGVSRENIMPIFGWLSAKIRKEKRFFDSREVDVLRHFYCKRFLLSIKTFRARARKQVHRYLRRGSYSERSIGKNGE